MKQVISNGTLRSRGRGTLHKPNGVGCVGERTSNEGNEPCRLRRGERYEVCEDALKGLGCCPARKTQFFASRPLDAQLAKYEIDLFVRWQAARGMAIAAHCLLSTRHYSGVIYPPVRVLTQLFFLRIIKAQDDNDTDADALDRASASCIFGNERKRCRQ